METSYIKGVVEIQTPKIEDERGYFLSCFKENNKFTKDIWSEKQISQVNISFTKKKGSVRGLHFQKVPFSEYKIIRCIKGKVWDVAVDLRPYSETYKKWIAYELCEKKSNSLIIPDGCAHGFQTLVNSCELLYLHSKNYAPNYESGIRWNDPSLNINWPLNVTVVSSRDKTLPLLKDDI